MRGGRLTLHTSPEVVPGAEPFADLEALAYDLQVPVELLRNFADISDPKNRHLFTAEAARKAFAGVKVGRDTQF